MARLTFAAARAAINGSSENLLRTGLAMLASGQDQNGNPAGGVFGYATGVSGTVNVPAGASVRKVSALGGAGAGSITIGSGAAVGIPAGVSFNEPIGDDSLIGPVAIVFAGTAEYFVRWVV